MNNQVNTYKVAKTGKKVKCRWVAKDEYENVKTGERYNALDIDIYTRKTYWQKRAHIGRFGVALYLNDQVLFCRFQTPAIAIEYINGFDYYFDIQLCFLCYLVGIRFIFLKNKR